LAAAKSKAKHADEWDQTETEAVEHLVHTLSIFGIGFQNPTIGSEPAHATAVVDDQLVDLLAIRGNSHDECIKHSKTFLPYPRRQTLLVSRDRDNNEFSQRFGSFLETNSARFGQERRITDPQGGVLHLGYRKILDFFQNAPTAAALRTAIYDELVA
jgi:hypothetical protein